MRNQAYPRQSKQIVTKIVHLTQSKQMAVKKVERTRKEMKEAKAGKIERASEGKSSSAQTKKEGKDGKCSDKKCPVHAGLSLRGRSFTGEMIRKNGKTVKIEWPRFRYFPKYERYAKLSSGVLAHLPDCMQDFEVGQKVKVTECRPLSKMKHFVVVGKE